MDEIMRIADRATILRDGRRVTTAPISELTLEAIVTNIVGRRVSNFADVRGDDSEPGDVLVELEDVSGAYKPRDVHLRLRRGQILGIAGLLGSGRSSLARIICGLDPLASGEIRLAGRPTRMTGADDAIRHGIVLIPEDRIRQGVIADHSVSSNICLPVLGRLSTLSWVSNTKARSLTDGQIAKLRIKTASRDSAVRSLSGGNQQKVVLAKWLAADPDVLVLDEPTAGIDIGSKSEIIGLIRELARAGKGIILISSELTELLAASDRILLMAEGRITGEIARRDFVDAEGEADHVGDAERRLQVMLQQAS
jgi:ribose transport system ATP-binding protein